MAKAKAGEVRKPPRPTAEREIEVPSNAHVGVFFQVPADRIPQGFVEKSSKQSAAHENGERPKGGTLTMYEHAKLDVADIGRLSLKLSGYYVTPEVDAPKGPRRRMAFWFSDYAAKNEAGREHALGIFAQEAAKIWNECEHYRNPGGSCCFIMKGESGRKAPIDNLHLIDAPAMDIDEERESLVEDGVEAKVARLDTAVTLAVAGESVAEKNAKVIGASTAPKLESVEETVKRWQNCPPPKNTKVIDDVDPGFSEAEKPGVTNLGALLNKALEKLGK